MQLPMALAALPTLPLSVGIRRQNTRQRGQVNAGGSHLGMPTDRAQAFQADAKPDCRGLYSAASVI
jgi:hypothetical protein